MLLSELIKLDKDQVKNGELTRTSLRLHSLWIECTCIVLTHFHTANPHCRKLVFVVKHCKLDFSPVLFKQLYNVLIIMQIPFCIYSALHFAPDAWHGELQEYQAAQTGPRKQIQHLFVAVSILPRRQSAALTTVQAFNATQNLLLTQKGVCVRACVRVCVCVFVCVRVFVCICWGGTDRNLGVCSCHNEMSIFMTCCLLSGTCELFLLQTSASDICTFTDSSVMSRI